MFKRVEDWKVILHHSGVRVLIHTAAVGAGQGIGIDVGQGLLLVQKKEGALQPCIDYKGLTQVSPHQHLST